jgi:hypothetical protein
VGKKKKHGKRVPRQVRTMPAMKPGVHVCVVSASGNLADAAALVRPAVLYADKVTVYSPAAVLLGAALNLAKPGSREQRLRRLLDIGEQVPELAAQLTMSAETRQLLTLFLQNPTAMQAAMRAAGLPASEIRRLNEMMDSFDSTWDTSIADAVANSVEAVGGSELGVAIAAGAVEIAPLASTSQDGLVAGMLRAATGVRDDGLSDDVVGSFVARVIEVLSDHRAFPLLDTEAAGLIRTLEGETDLPAPHKGPSRAVEIASAAAFMGYLPAFEQMPMDETLDLRRTIDAPLIRFRSAMTSMSESFSTRPIDDGFAADVEDAWRREVEPRLLEIRETLAEHSLLREAASVAMGDPRRLMMEAGGVFATAVGTRMSLSSFMTAMVSGGVPVADVALRALKDRNKGIDIAKQSAFYFLHEVGERARES